MKRFGWIVLSAFAISFCCACHAVTPGPCTTRSSAAVVSAPEETETTEAQTEAYVSSEAMTEPATEAVQGQLMRATTEVNIRSEASKDSESVGGLEEGETVTVIGTEGKWSVIMYEGVQCYVFSTYLEAAE